MLTIDCVYLLPGPNLLHYSVSQEMLHNLHISPKRSIVDRFMDEAYWLASVESSLMLAKGLMVCCLIAVAG